MKIIAFPPSIAQFLLQLFSIALYIYIYKEGPSKQETSQEDR